MALRKKVDSSYKTQRYSHTLQATQSPHARAMAATSRFVPELSDIGDGGAHVVLALLSFLPTNKKLPLDLLFRGATPRMRWTAQGETEELQAIESGLDPKLQELLSNVSRVHDAINKLNSWSVVTFSDQTWSLDEQLACSVRRALFEDTVYWKHQALIITYRAIPWKHIEFP